MQLQVGDHMMKNKDTEKGKRMENEEEQEKTKQHRWTASMDNVLLETLEEQARQGKKHGNSWDNNVWKIVIDVIYERTGVLVERKHIDSRLRIMKGEYRNFTELCGISGFGMDHARKIVDAPKDVWTELFKNPVSKDKYSKLRDKCIKWDYDQLSIVIGNYHATGSYSMDGLDCVDVTDNSSDLREVEDDTDLDNTERTSMSSKRPLPSLEKRKHGKKTRQADLVKEMISEMSQKLETVAHSVDPMSFGRMLQEALRNMTGFSKRYLFAALAILRKDPVEGEIFLLGDEEDKKYMLERMHHQIGDI